MKQSIKYFAKRIISAFLMAGMLSVTANATRISIDTATGEATAMVRYLGTDNDSYVFNVAYKNEGSARFQVNITDEAGNTLFTGIFSDKKFDKRFRLTKGIYEGKLNFSIRDIKSNVAQNFQITTLSKVVEDVVVTKMN